MMTPHASGRRRIGRLIATITVAGLAVTGTWFVGHAATAAVPAPSLALETLSPPALAPAAITTPDLGGVAVAAEGFGTLAERDADVPRPIASITKIVTALVLLEAHPLTQDDEGPTITFTDADVKLLRDTIAAGGSRAMVRSGLKLTLRQALEAMLIPSANNYAVSLANWAFGSEAALVERARTWLRAHGLGNIVINDASGMGGTNVATPHDLLKLATLALANPVIAKIVGTATVEVPGVGTLTNTNELVGRGYLTGIKTGTGLGANASNLLFSFVVDTGATKIPLVGVVLGAKSHDAIDAALPALIEQVKAGFHQVELVPSGAPVATVTTNWGQSATLRASSTASAVLWGNPKVTLTPTLRQVDGAAKGQEVGTVDISIDRGAGEPTRLSVPVTVDAAIAAPDLWWRLTHIVELR